MKTLYNMILTIHFTLHCRTCPLGTFGFSAPGALPRAGTGWPLETARYRTSGRRRVRYLLHIAMCSMFSAAQSGNSDWDEPVPNPHISYKVSMTRCFQVPRDREWPQRVIPDERFEPVGATLGDQGPHIGPRARISGRTRSSASTRAR